MSPKSRCSSHSSAVAFMAKTVQSEAQDTVDSMFRAFSDRTRLRILHVLRGGELCVGDIVESLRAPQPRISRHLAYLRKANLVLVRKSGLWSHYSPRPRQDAVPPQAAGVPGKVLRRSARTAGRQRRAAKIRKSGGCCPKV